MTKDEQEMQEKKIRLMKISMFLGAVYGAGILALLLKIAANTNICK